MTSLKKINKVTKLASAIFFLINVMPFNDPVVLDYYTIKVAYSEMKTGCDLQNVAIYESPLQ